MVPPRQSYSLRHASEGRKAGLVTQSRLHDFIGWNTDGSPWIWLSIPKKPATWWSAFPP